MNSASGDIVGIIYAKDAADSTYGSVLQSLLISSSQLNSLAEISGGYIMFLVRNNHVIIADGKRNLLSPAGEEFSSDTVFNYFSTAKLLELLNIGDSPDTMIEQRREVLSITNGNFTLENSRPCPPFCPD